MHLERSDLQDSSFALIQYYESIYIYIQNCTFPFFSPNTLHVHPSERLTLGSTVSLSLSMYGPSFFFSVFCLHGQLFQHLLLLPYSHALLKLLQLFPLIYWQKTNNEKQCHRRGPELYRLHFKVKGKVKDFRSEMKLKLLFYCGKHASFKFDLIIFFFSFWILRVLWISLLGFLFDCIVECMYICFYLLISVVIFEFVSELRQYKC